ncbi:IclR family transcriptional regulator [Tenggerimyces flavus]|uniref:IclR family transcriptional regulator n=1 Tax=Tenggerimyces flavus TaxID=1708749 RepID=A0ABV7YCV5_9ACTN|nr:IclR family transcriptional regulator C-terminal domain-containing protein [Tenggerimyces flavus]MBM7787135.1 DNA-binding IclR family transcriptional regulator [Tenggerimyces flavus]
MSDEIPEDFVRSVSRALRILEVVGREPGLPVKAVARRVQLNISTTYHLIRTLAYEGYVVRLPNGCYELGQELPRRFHELVGSLARPRRSSEVLRHLQAVTGLSAYLGRFRDGRVVIAEVVEGGGSPYLEDFEVGLEISAHATAVGKALLASMPRPARRAYLADQGLRPFTANTLTDLVAIESELSSLRADAPVIEHGEFRDNVSCAAGLVTRSEPDDPYWAVVISVWGDDVRPEICTELMRAARDLATA